MNMLVRLTHPGKRRRQRGAVAVELAGVFMVLVLLLLPTFLLGRIYLQYNVISSVTTTAARFVAKGTLAELKDGTRAQAAQVLVGNLLRDAGISAEPSVSIQCLPAVFCNTNLTGVQAAVQVAVPADGVFIYNDFYITAVSTVRYP